MDRLRLDLVRVRSSQLEMKFVKIIYMQYWNFNFQVQGSSLHVWGPYYRTLRENNIGLQELLENKRTYKSPFRAKTFRNWKIKKWLSTRSFFEGKKDWKMRLFIRNIRKRKQKRLKKSFKRTLGRCLAQSVFRWEHINLLTYHTFKRKLWSDILYGSFLVQKYLFIWIFKKKNSEQSQ